MWGKAKTPLNSENLRPDAATRTMHYPIVIEDDVVVDDQRDDNVIDLTDVESKEDDNRTTSATKGNNLYSSIANKRQQQQQQKQQQYFQSRTHYHQQEPELIHAGGDNYKRERGGVEDFSSSIETDSMMPQVSPPRYSSNKVYRSTQGGQQQHQLPRQGTKEHPLILEQGRDGPINVEHLDDSCHVGASSSRRNTWQRSRPAAVDTKQVPESTITTSLQNGFTSGDSPLLLSSAWKKNKGEQTTTVSLSSPLSSSSPRHQRNSSSSSVAQSTDAIISAEEEYSSHQQRKATFGTTSIVKWSSSSNKVQEQQPPSSSQQTSPPPPHHHPTTTNKNKSTAATTTTKQVRQELDESEREELQQYNGTWTRRTVRFHNGSSNNNNNNNDPTTYHQQQQQQMMPISPSRFLDPVIIPKEEDNRKNRNLLSSIIPPPPPRSPQQKQRLYKAHEQQQQQDRSRMNDNDDNYDEETRFLYDSPGSSRYQPRQQQGQQQQPTDSPNAGERKTNSMTQHTASHFNDKNSVSTTTTTTNQFLQEKEENVERRKGTTTTSPSPSSPRAAGEQYSRGRKRTLWTRPRKVVTSPSSSTTTQSAAEDIVVGNELTNDTIPKDEQQQGQQGQQSLLEQNLYQPGVDDDSPRQQQQQQEPQEQQQTEIFGTTALASLTTRRGLWDIGTRTSKRTTSVSPKWIKKTPREIPFWKESKMVGNNNTNTNNGIESTAVSDTFFTHNLDNNNNKANQQQEQDLATEKKDSVNLLVSGHVDSPMEEKESDFDSPKNKKEGDDAQPVFTAVAARETPADAKPEEVVEGNHRSRTSSSDDASIASSSNAGVILEQKDKHQVLEEIAADTSTMPEKTEPIIEKASLESEKGESIVNPRRLQVLEKARALLYSPKFQDILERNKNRQRDVVVHGDNSPDTPENHQKGEVDDSLSMRVLTPETKTTESNVVPELDEKNHEADPDEEQKNTIEHTVDPEEREQRTDNRSYSQQESDMPFDEYPTTIEEASTDEKDPDMPLESISSQDMLGTLDSADPIEFYRNFSKEFFEVDHQEGIDTPDSGITTTSETPSMDEKEAFDSENTYRIVSALNSRIYPGISKSQESNEASNIFPSFDSQLPREFATLPKETTVIPSFDSQLPREFATLPKKTTACGSFAELDIERIHRSSLTESDFGGDTQNEEHGIDPPNNEEDASATPGSPVDTVNLPLQKRMKNSFEATETRVRGDEEQGSFQQTHDPHEAKNADGPLDQTESPQKETRDQMREFQVSEVHVQPTTQPSLDADRDVGERISQEPQGLDASQLLSQSETNIDTRSTANDTSILWSRKRSSSVPKNSFRHDEALPKEDSLEGHASSKELNSTTPFDQLRVTLMKLDLSDDPNLELSSSDEKPSAAKAAPATKELARTRVGTLPIDPILSNYSWDHSISSTTDKDNNGSKTEQKMGLRMPEEGDGRRSGSHSHEGSQTVKTRVGRTNSRSKSSSERSGTVRFGAPGSTTSSYRSGSRPEILTNTSSSKGEESERTVSRQSASAIKSPSSRMTPVHRNGTGSLNVSFGGGIGETAADESDSNNDRDADTREDTDSKISLVSYLGSDDSDLDTNFESATVPMIVKMLDMGCAWLEGRNCGFEAPSLLKESKCGGGGLLQHAGNFSCKTLKKKIPLVNKYTCRPAIKKSATNADKSKAASSKSDPLNETPRAKSSGREEQSDSEGHDSNTGNAEALKPKGETESRGTQMKDFSVESHQETTPSQTTEAKKNRKDRGQEDGSTRPNPEEATASSEDDGSSRSVGNKVTLLEPEDTVDRNSTENQIERSDPSDSSLLQPIDVTGVENVHNRGSMDALRLLVRSESESTINLLSLDGSPSNLPQTNSAILDNKRYSGNYQRRGENMPEDKQGLMNSDYADKGNFAHDAATYHSMTPASDASKTGSIDQHPVSSLGGVRHEQSIMGGHTPRQSTSLSGSEKLGSTEINDGDDIFFLSESENSAKDDEGDEYFDHLSVNVEDVSDPPEDTSGNSGGRRSPLRQKEDPQETHFYNDMKHPHLAYDHEVDRRKTTIDPEEIRGSLPMPSSSNSHSRNSGGPEQSSARSRHSKHQRSHSHRSAKKNEKDNPQIDAAMFRNLTEEERLAALELAESLRHRAEKLKKRRKKREKRMKQQQHATKYSS